MDRSAVTVLTTGANYGIGNAVALHTARLGYRSVCTVRSEEKAELVHRGARAAGLSVETALLDVTDDAACEQIVEKYRPLALVNNAGYNSTGAIEDLDEADARLCMETMAIAPLKLARLSMPHMRAAGWGRVIQMSSIIGRTTLPLCGWYQASKFALEAASDALRTEVASAGVSVVLIEPGAVKTGIWGEGVWSDDDRLLATPFTPSYQRLRTLMSMQDRLMNSPEKIARIVGRCLTSDRPRARYLIGLDAHLLVAMRRVLPTSIEDAIMRRALGLMTHPGNGEGNVEGVAT